jgi:pimeloyl-ACP methyl ester carboxylesterase
MPRTTIGGLEIAYREQGDARPALLLIHGAGCGSTHFAPLLPLLSAHARVVALDLPGHGQSATPEPPPSPSDLLELYLNTATGLAEKLGLGRYMVAGHSMGGAVAQLLALRHPERVCGLGLITTAARLKVAPPVLSAIRDNFQGLPLMMAAVGYSPATAPDKAQAFARAQLQAEQETVLADFRACGLFDLRARVGQLNKAPFSTTIISAGDDMLTPPKLQLQLQELIPRAELSTIPRAGHFCCVERPNAVAEILARALSKADPGPRTSP